MFTSLKQPVEKSTPTEVNDYLPGAFLLFTILCLIVVSFFEIPYFNSIKNGVICMIICIIDVIRSCRKEKSLRPARLVIKELDINTLVMLCALFIVIKAITNAGIIDAIADGFTLLGHKNTFLLYTVIVLVSVLLSAFIDNIPYVAAMLPVIEGIAMRMGTDPTVLYFGLLSGATLGGNITPFGASANVAGIGILQKEGYVVDNKDFFEIGIPFTLTAVIIGYVTIWLIWG